MNKLKKRKINLSPFLPLILVIILLLSVNPTLAQDKDEIIFTTYYPAPYGVYNELAATKSLSVGPFSPGTAEGRISVAGSAAEFSFARRNLTSWPTFPAAGDRYVWYNPSGSARLWTEENGDLLTVLSNGNVGIGTTSPSGKFHVYDSTGASSFQLSGDAGGYPRVYLGGSSGAVAGVINRSASGATLYFGETSDTGGYYFRGSGNHLIEGNVGIGTTSPDPRVRLDVVGNMRMLGTPGAPDQRAYFILQGSQSGSHEWHIAAPPAGSTDLGSFGIGDASLGLQRLVIRGDGGFEIRGSRTYLWADGGGFHWFMVGGETEGVYNALGFHVPTKQVVVGPGWTKTFMIDHPLDPENKHLTHAVIEGPENAVFYRGEASLVNGQATVKLPDYFEALTREEKRTVQLTAKGIEPFLLSYTDIVKGEFTVYGTKPDGEFSWEVKAIRADIEPLKVEIEKGESSG